MSDQHTGLGAKNAMSWCANLEFWAAGEQFGHQLMQSTQADQLISGDQPGGGSAPIPPTSPSLTIWSVASRLASSLRTTPGDQTTTT